MLPVARRYQGTEMGKLEDFSSILEPFSLLMGFQRVKGYYKDTVLIHVAHHLLILLGPASQLLRLSPLLSTKHAAQMLPPRLARWLFVCKEGDGDEPRCGIASAYNATAPTDKRELRRRKMGNRYPAGLVEVVVGEPGKSCNAACAGLDRVCTDWGAIFVQKATHVLLARGNGSEYRRRKFDKCKMDVWYGPIMSAARSFLPVIDSRSGPDDFIVLGASRLFQCATSMSQSLRRVCPCFKRTAALISGSANMF